MTLNIPHLTSDRLLLEPLSRAHADGMFALWSRPEVCRYAGPAADIEGRSIALPARSAADSDRILDFFVEARRREAGFRWALLTKTDKAFIGAAGFNSLGACSEYAYHLRPDYWGRGLMREASHLALRWLFEDTTHSSAEAFIEPDNVASMGLAHRLGFTPTETVKDGARRFVLEAGGPHGRPVFGGSERADQREVVPLAQRAKLQS